MIIEFFGTPGAGKSTLLKVLVASMPRAREAKVVSHGEVAFGVLRFVLQHPVSFVIWIYMLAINANGLFRYKLGLLAHSMAARADAERDSKNGRVFIDEGLVQRILSVFDTPLSKKRAEFVLRMSPLPDAVVVMRGGDFGRFTSAIDRQGSPRVRGGEAALQEWVKTVTHNTHVVTEALQGRVVVIEARRDANSGEVRDEIERLQARVL